MFPNITHIKVNNGRRSVILNLIELTFFRVHASMKSSMKSSCVEIKTEVRHVGLPLSAECTVLSVCPAVSIVQSRAAPANTRWWPYAALMLAHRLQRWANNRPVLVTVACLAPRWMWANVTDGRPALTQFWFKSSCRYRQHEVLTRAEWILASTGDQCWFDAGSAWPACVHLFMVRS